MKLEKLISIAVYCLLISITGGLTCLRKLIFCDLRYGINVISTWLVFFCSYNSFQSNSQQVPSGLARSILRTTSTSTSSIAHVRNTKSYILHYQFPEEFIHRILEHIGVPICMPHTPVFSSGTFKKRGSTDWTGFRPGLEMPDGYCQAVVFVKIAQIILKARYRVWVTSDFVV